MKTATSPLHQRVLQAFREAGGSGLTDDELSTRTGLLRISAGARRNELVECGELVDTGETRSTSSGRPAKVWTLSGVTGSSRPIVVHRAGPPIATLGGARLQVCGICGASLPPEFSEGDPVYERAGEFTAIRPTGLTFRVCRHGRGAR